MPLTEMVLRVADEYPDRPAIVADGQRLTYAGLVADSRRVIAAVRAAHAAQPNPPIPARETGGIPITAVSTTSAFHTARIVAGLAGYRAVSATIDPRWPLAHQVSVIVTTGIGLVISDSAELAAALRAAAWTGQVLPLAGFRRREAEFSSHAGTLPTAERPTAERPTVRDGTEPFLMLFSSGTTRNPKAFLKSRAQYRANFSISSAHLEPLPGVVTLAPGPVSYSLTLYALIECLASGGTACLADAFDPIETGQTIARESVTRMVVVPAMVQALAYAARRDPQRFATLQLIVTGGANLSEKIRRLLDETMPGVRLISYYGAAEIGFIGDSRSGNGTLINVYDGVLAQVRPNDDALGTIWIKAAACSAGYLAGTTPEVLLGTDGWATVHDQGRWVDGQLQLAGRAGDIAITGGHKVSLTEVERAFDGMAGLGSVCAIAIPDARMGSVIALVIEKDSATGVLTKDDLAAVARESLAPQFVPHQWYAVGELPRTVGGKIRRGATAELVRERIDVDRL
ncbi:MAG: class I adenylate-forming enzyme family protein [Nakamurella sp.]